MSNDEFETNEYKEIDIIETVEEIETVKDEVQTHVAWSGAETIRVTGHSPAFAPDMFRFGRGRFRTVEFLLKNIEHVFSVRSESCHDIVIGRKDANLNYTPIIDLSNFGGKLYGVSRRHATLNNRKGLLYITDHTTTNGTYVNGSRIDPEQPHVLTHGDRLQIGRIQMMVKFVDRVLAT